MNASNLPDASVLERFNAFIREASTLRGADAAAQLAPLDAFGEFVRAATPIATGRLLDVITRLGYHARLKRYCGVADILAVGGLSGAENPYTELLAWALGTAVHPPSALRRQRAWLRTLPFGEALELVTPATVVTQVWTDDGVPDLVLRTERWSIIVEAKTWTEEHATPKGRMQTVAYPEAVRAAWQLDASHRIHVVYLTPNGRRAASSDAALCTYAMSAAAFAEAIDVEPLPSNVQPAFEVLIGHWLTMPLRMDGNLPRFLERVEAWSREAHQSPEILLPHVADIEAARAAFLPGENHDLVPIQ